jgi:hypothetical protein
MKKIDFYQALLQRIPRKGMPKKSQEIFPHIAKNYIDGKNLSRLKSELSKTHRVYAEDIYKRLDENYVEALNQIKTVLLKKATNIMTSPPSHPRDLLEDYIFAHTMIRYYVEFVNKREGLIKKLAKASGVKLEFLKNREYNKNRKELERIGKKSSFYDFLFNLNKEN